jgi:hypothetical protein
VARPVTLKTSTFSIKDSAKTLSICHACGTKPIDTTSIEIISEIITKYKPDGINLDYIRYPQAISKTENGSWGYTEFARQDFKSMYGSDPIDLKKEDKLWKDWDSYRREKITNFVRKYSGDEDPVQTLFVAKVFLELNIFPTSSSITSSVYDAMVH